jgi:ubiquinone biosynthesis protein
MIFLYVRRTLRLVFITLIFSIIFLLNWIFRFTSGPSLLRRYFQTCDAAFVKIGQILAMRYDLLPAEYCDELLKLLDSLPPLPSEVIVTLIEADLGRPLAACFQQFEVIPIGSASLAQVHRAQLHTRETVAVKVRRPGIQRQFQIDFANIRFFAWVIDQLGILGRIAVGKLAEEMIDLTREELDFRREARNIQMFHELMRQDDIDHYTPKVYFEYCGVATITMEYLSGVNMTEFMTAIYEKDQVKLDQWKERGITPKRSARLVMRSTLVQMFRHRQFHADPHIANLILMDGGTLGYVDFGMVGWMDERQWKQQFRLRQAVANEEIYAAYEAVLDILAPLPARDLSTFEVRLKSLIRDWILASKNPYATTLEKSSGYFFLQLFNLIRSARLRIPFDVVRLFRTMGIADIVMLRLSPELDWTPDLNEFIREETQYQLERLLRRQTDVTALETILIGLANSSQQILEIVDANSAEGVESRRRVKSDSGARLMWFSALGWLRVGTLIGIVAILADQWVLQRYFQASPWAGWSAPLGNVGLVVIGLLVVVLLLGRWRGRLE